MLKIVLFSLIFLLSLFNFPSISYAKTYNSLNAYVLDSIGVKYDDLTKSRQGYIKASMELGETKKNNVLYEASESLKKASSKKKEEVARIKKQTDKIKKELESIKTTLPDKILNGSKEDVIDVYSEYLNKRTEYYNSLDYLEDKSFNIMYEYKDTKSLENKRNELRDEVYDKNSTDYIPIGLFSELRRPFRAEFNKVGDYEYEIPLGSDVYSMFNGIVSDVKQDKVIVVSLRNMYILYTGLDVNVKVGDILRQNQKLGKSVKNVSVKLYYDKSNYSIERIFQ